MEHADASRFFQLINRRYTRSSMITTSNKRVSEWADLFGDEVQAVAILDRLLHDAETTFPPRQLYIIATCTADPGGPDEAAGARRRRLPRVSPLARWAPVVLRRL
ncbi:MAG: ATP-binding protein [Solirubrobacterales bacterium]|nr:ATP-binding protein [Solirubrobacterales bacterium]